MNLTDTEKLEAIKNFTNNVNILDNEKLFRKLVNDIYFDNRDYKSVEREWEMNWYKLVEHKINDPLKDVKRRYASMERMLDTVLGEERKNWYGGN